MSERAERPAPPRVWLLPAAVALGWMASLAGIGGGLFTVPLLHLVWRVELRRAVATSLGLGLTLAIAATLTEAARDVPAISWPVVGVTAAGSLVGAQVGIAVSRRLDVLRLKAVFVIVLGVVGLRVLWGLASGGGADPVTEALGREIGALELAASAAIGVAAGFVAPLLGIGGGLVMVPGLMLAVAPLGFQGARACSLAVAIVAAGRSLWLHARDGRVEWELVRWLVPGAVVGGVLGVVSVHSEGAEKLAQAILAGVLLLTAWRFARDVARSPRRRDA